MPDSDRVPKPSRQHRTHARNGRNSGALRTRRAHTDEAPSALHAMVEEHPWTTVGAAAGVGLAVGFHSRKLVASELGGMLAATVTGLATRFAIDALVQALDPRRESP